MSASGSRSRRVVLRHGRVVALRAVRPGDADEIVQAFERLSPASRYMRFLQHKRVLDPSALRRGVTPEPGRAWVCVATVPAEDGYDIVGAAQYLPAAGVDPTVCEFAITVADDWHGSGLATQLMAAIVRRARRDGYRWMEGLVHRANRAMLGLARRMKFAVVEPDAGDEAETVCVRRSLVVRRRRPAAAAAAAVA